MPSRTTAQQQNQAPHRAKAAEKLRLVLGFLARFEHPQNTTESGLVGAVAGQLLNLLEPYLSTLDADLLEAFLFWLAGSLERCANQDISVKDLDAWLRGELDDAASREIESVHRLRRQLTQEAE